MKESCILSVLIKCFIHRCINSLWLTLYNKYISQNSEIEISKFKVQNRRSWIPLIYCYFLNVWDVLQAIGNSISHCECCYHDHQLNQMHHILPVICCIVKHHLFESLPYHRVCLFGMLCHNQSQDFYQLTWNIRERCSIAI